jgi:hypothetical protein
MSEKGITKVREPQVWPVEAQDTGKPQSSTKPRQEQEMPEGRGKSYCKHEHEFREPILGIRRGNYISTKLQRCGEDRPTSASSH